MTEKEIMLSGGLYDPFDPQLVEERLLARSRFTAYNATDPRDAVGRAAKLRELFGSVGTGLIVEPPFFCDYGTNITVGNGVFFNFNCVILDVAAVTIGNHVLFGPNVQIYTATHPLNAAERRAGRERRSPSPSRMTSGSAGASL